MIDIEREHQRATEGCNDVALVTALRTMAVHGNHVEPSRGEHHVTFAEDKGTNDTGEKAGVNSGSDSEQGDEGDEGDEEMDEWEERSKMTRDEMKAARKAATKKAKVKYVLHKNPCTIYKISLACHKLPSGKSQNI